MSFLEEIFGKPPAADGRETCPNCGWPLNDTGDDRFECSNPKCHCVAFRVNGEIMDAFDPRRRGGAAGRCECCQQSLNGGSLTLPWEDGNNAYAYVRCPHCGHKNIRDGYGEDD